MANKPPSHVAFRTMLRQCIQQPDESVGAFVADLLRLAGDCEDSEQLVRDQLIHGLDDSAVLLAVLLARTTISDMLQLLRETDLTNSSTTKKCLPNVKVAATSPPDSPTSILSLPPEVLATIFKLLDMQGKGRVAQVCCSWKDIAEMTPVWCHMWNQVNVSASDQSFVCQIGHLARRGVRRIKFADYSNTFDEELLVMPPSLLSDLPLITHLDISCCSSISDHAVHQISTNFKKMVYLKLIENNCSEMTDASIASICEGLKRLKHLTLIGCLLITDAGMHQLANSNLPLRSLYLKCCKSLTDASFRYLSVGKPGLEGLKLCYCPDVTGAGIKCVTTMRELMHLKLYEVNLVTDCQLKMLANMKSLRTLHLAGSQVNDSIILIVAKGSAPIVKLNLRCCEITDASLMVIATMPRLRQLDISYCPHVTLEGLECLMRGNGNLTSLDIKHCRSINSMALTSIVTCQPNLQWLSLSHFHIGQCWQLEMVTQKLRHLTVLKVDGENSMVPFRVTTPGLL